MEEEEGKTSRRTRRTREVDEPEEYTHPLEIGYRVRTKWRDNTYR